MLSRLWARLLGCFGIFFGTSAVRASFGFTSAAKCFPGSALLHHQQPSIIFRDLKPANIMLSRTGRLYLIDFGIARRYTQGRDTAPLGSPGYAAPQTDIYGLGVTLQTLLTGKEPIEVLPVSTPPTADTPATLMVFLRASARPGR